MVNFGARNGGSPAGMLLDAENGRMWFALQMAQAAPASKTVIAFRAAINW
jgi:hypothetical protein